MLLEQTSRLIKFEMSTAQKMKTKQKMFYSAKGELFNNARMLRKNETEAEKLLWTRLARNQLDGLRFKRQHPIAHYVADFYCHKTKLVIELDGPYHQANNQKIYDEARTDFMIGLGLKVLRFSDEEVMLNMEKVVETISANIASHT